MIDRRREEGIWVYGIGCDVPACDKFQEFPSTASFMDTINQAKANGWLIKREDGEWSHYCPGCRMIFGGGGGSPDPRFPED